MRSPRYAPFKAAHYSTLSLSLSLPVSPSLCISRRSASCNARVGSSFVPAQTMPSNYGPIIGVTKRRTCCPTATSGSSLRPSSLLSFSLFFFFCFCCCSSQFRANCYGASILGSFSAWQMTCLHLFGSSREIIAIG